MLKELNHFVVIVDLESVFSFASHFVNVKMSELFNVFDCTKSFILNTLAKYFATADA